MEKIIQIIPAAPGTKAAWYYVHDGDVDEDPENTILLEDVVCWALVVDDHGEEKDLYPNMPESRSVVGMVDHGHPHLTEVHDDPDDLPFLRYVKPGEDLAKVREEAREARNRWLIRKRREEAPHAKG